MNIFQKAPASGGSLTADGYPSTTTIIIQPRSRPVDGARVSAHVMCLCDFNLPGLRGDLVSKQKI